MSPYVPSRKTDGKSEDREIIDIAVDALALELATRITNKYSFLPEYKNVFMSIARELFALKFGLDIENTIGVNLASAIWKSASNHNDEMAELGELNYAVTRLIQRVPQIKVERGDWEEKDELRYWLYALTAEALLWVHNKTLEWGTGTSAVFMDVLLEYKFRVNQAYEAEQIVKNGDCYDAPNYSKLVRVHGQDGKFVGHIHVLVKRSDETLKNDTLNGVVRLKVM
jgi:hypothetical protein